MTRSDSLHSARILVDRYSRRNILRTGGAALAVTAAATLPRLASAAQTGAATPETGSPLDVNAIDEFISGAMESYGVPGAAVAVIHDGDPLLVKGYGIRELGSDTPVDADTVFQLASNTKPMTAFTLGTLVDEGLIGWDTPITEILPELQLWDTYPTRYLTSRDVFAHRSGFPAFGGDLLGHVGYDRAEMLRRLRYIPPAGSFRSVAAYSNLGFFIAGEVIARLTGAPWEDAMQARLMDPVGMSRSGPALADRPADGNMAANHGLVDGKLQTVPADDHGVYGAAGSAMSTAHDLALWMQMLLDGGQAQGKQLMKPETVNEMFVPSMVAATSFSEMAPIDAHSGLSYGLGWANYHYHGYEIMEKGGALDGVRTVVCVVPQLNAGIAVVANLNLTALPEAVRGFWLEQLLGKADVDVQQEIREAGAMVAAQFASLPQLPANSVAPSVPLESFAGVYQNALYSGFRVIVEGDTMRLEAGPAKKPATLEHFSHDTFLLDWGNVTSIPSQMTFTVGPDGLAVGFDHEELGRFERVITE
jgi:CubicO group peptidase (beta-lactamase class C family)